MNLNTQFEDGHNRRHDTIPYPRIRQEDTVVDSDALRPAATPAGRRLMGWLLNARLLSPNPECLCFVHTTGRLSRPGLSESLSVTAVKP